MPARRAHLLWSAAVTIAAATITACSSGGNGSSTSATSSSAAGVSVKAGDKTCDVSTAKLAAGRHTITVENTSSQVTEVYVYAAGDRVVGEIENVGPATKRTLVVELGPGDYQVACKPGMAGTGIRSALKVTGVPSNAAVTLDGRLTEAVASYRAYVASQSSALTSTTVDFVAAVKAGNAAQARALYPAARLHYERIEPIAESFGELDPLIDMRIDDATEGTPFVGFHRLEQDLWTKNMAASGPTADALLANVRTLQAAIRTVAITPITMGGGAKSLLDEVAKSKVTGEEERYSRIDLVDFQANVEGSQFVYEALRPVLAERDPELVSTLDTRFAALLALLRTHRAVDAAGGVPGSGFVRYDALTAAQVKALAVQVDAISEPLGEITGVLARQ